MIDPSTIIEGECSNSRVIYEDDSFLQSDGSFFQEKIKTPKVTCSERKEDTYLVCRKTYRKTMMEFFEYSRNKE